MFLRKKKKSLLKAILDFIWPSIGFKRAFHYIAHRLGRLPASPYQIACGFACGASISFTPFIGLHFILSAILAFVLRSSILASALGTAIGNPITFPFIWALTYATGTKILGIDSIVNISALFQQTLEDFILINQWHFTLITHFNFAIEIFDVYAGLWKSVWLKIYPLFIGSLVWVVIVWMIFFFSIRPIMRAYKKANEIRIQKRRKDTL